MRARVGWVEIMEWQVLITNIVKLMDIINYVGPRSKLVKSAILVIAG
jgi:hypothetical protein